MNPMQYPIYKGTGGKWGAIQFNPQRPHFYNGKQKDKTGSECFEIVDGRRKLKEGWKEREGCVFVEIAPAIGNNTYDWKQKIIMALSVNDLGKVLYFLVTGKSPNRKDREYNGKPTNAMTIMHDPHAKSASAGQIQKYMKFYSPGGTSEGCMITVTHKTKDAKLEHQVPVSGDELITLRTLVQAAISSGLNW